LIGNEHLWHIKFLSSLQLWSKYFRVIFYFSNFWMIPKEHVICMHGIKLMYHYSRSRTLYSSKCEIFSKSSATLDYSHALQILTLQNKATFIQLIKELYSNKYNLIIQMRVLSSAIYLQATSHKINISCNIEMKAYLRRGSKIV
jgi:hypothetical protein